MERRRLHLRPLLLLRLRLRRPLYRRRRRLPRPRRADLRHPVRKAALQRHTVRDAMAEMPKEDRNILTLAYLHGHTNDQIAQALNVSVRTVSRRLTNALGKLEEHVTSLGVWMLSAVLLVLASLRNLR